MSQRSRVVNTHDCVESCTDGVDVGLLAVLVSSARIQDVPSMQNQNQYVDLGRLKALLRRALLRDGRVVIKVMNRECSERLFSLLS